MPDEQPNVGEAVEQITGLLTGQPPGKVEEPESGGDPAPSDDVPAALVPPAGDESGDSTLTPTVLAEKLGIKPDELFKKFLIPVDGGDPLTLEEFKGSGKDLREVKAAQNELAESKVTFENNVMLQRKLLEVAVSKIPRELLTEEMMSGVRQDHDDYVRTERAALVRIRPDLADATKVKATRDLLVDHLKPYGFHPIEVDGIIDHRMAKYVIDNAEREKRLRELSANGIQVAKAKSPRPSQTPAPSRAKDKPAATRQRPKTNQDKAAEVAALLGAK